MKLSSGLLLIVSIVTNVVVTVVLCSPVKAAEWNISALCVPEEEQLEEHEQQRRRQLQIDEFNYNFFLEETKSNSYDIKQRASEGASHNRYGFKYKITKTSKDFDDKVKEENRKKKIQSNHSVDYQEKEIGKPSTTDKNVTGIIKRRRRLGPRDVEKKILVAERTFNRSEDSRVNNYLRGRGQIQPFTKNKRNKDLINRTTTVMSSQGGKHPIERSLTEGRTTFHFKLHWTEGVCWQEEWDERDWCMECAGVTCVEGDVLWLKKCSEYDLNQRFEWIERTDINGTSLDITAPTNIYWTQMQYGMIKTACADLCYQQVRVNAYELRACNYSSPDQILVRAASTGVITSDIFEIYPYERYDKCLNQHHHPKAEEFILLTWCNIARNWDTNYWKMAWVREDTDECILDPNHITPGATGYLHEREPQCNKTVPCGVCVGDCDSDKHCADDLLCFRRKTFEPVPGCSGSGAEGVDYCYDPHNYLSEVSGILSNRTNPILQAAGDNPLVSGKSNTSNITSNNTYVDREDDIFNIRNLPCSTFSRCSTCEGDCDSDNDCEEGLVCYQRSGDGAVPNCHGYAVHGADYCANTTGVTRITNSFSRCRKNNPCVKCQGACTSDDVCSGDLKCFFRNDSTPIPGCFGDGIPGNGYCY